jgi:4-amino-4-deoxy-L-arabinose transferase-like glycosyltransferase
VLPFLALARLRLPARGVALGAALFVALGVPWYALLVARDPALADYFLDRQLLSRATAEGEGHLHGLLYLPFRGVVMGFLPWTPLVALAVYRLRPRRPLSRDPLELYLWLWTLAPIAFFELFPTKLPSYVLPSFPGAALLVGRALESARLDDRAGRGAVAASLGLAAVAAVLVGVLVGLALVAPARVERWLVPEELAAPFVFLAALAVTTAGLGALALRALRRGVPLAAACAALGVGYLVGYNALAAPAPDHAAEARVVRSVPGARVVQYGLFRPSLLFYLGDGAEHAVALRREFSERAGEPGAAHLALRHQDVEAWMRADVPTFVLAKASKEDEVARSFDAHTVRRTRHFALLANAAALEVLGGAAPH